MAEVTTVKLADGTVQTITGGDWGTFPWVHQANALSVAYRQIGDTQRASEWNGIYNRRLEIWQLIQAGKDRLEILAQFGQDLVSAPVEIAADIGNVALQTGGAVLTGVKGTATALPLLLLVALVVIGVGFRSGSLRVVR